MQVRKVEIINSEFIKIGPRHRELREEQVSSLMLSISKIGLKTPITVRQPIEDDDVFLIAGAHRLEACKRLGMEEIEAFVVEDDDEDAARMWEIAENLHRAELTALERDEHVSEWIRLADIKSVEVSVQSAQKPQGGRPESGISKASRELNIERSDASRAVKVASLTNEAKEAARDAGLDDNRSALLDAASKSEAEQAERIRQIAQEKEMRAKLRDQLTPQNGRGYSRLLSSWEAADQDARAAFLEKIGVRSFAGIEL